jgi:hypothetical protein
MATMSPRPLYIDLDEPPPRCEKTASFTVGDLTVEQRCIDFAGHGGRCSMVEPATQIVGLVPRAPAAPEKGAGA